MTDEETLKFCETLGADYWQAANRIASECSNLTGKELLDRRRKGHEELIDILRQQKRALDYHAGEKIEPETHHAAAVLLPALGGGAA